jgi:hypothetical protein
MSPHTNRLQHISSMVTAHDAQLHHVVRLRGSASPEIVDDACRYAWVQLLAAEHVDVRPPRWGALAWLTNCAVRRARMLSEVRRSEARAPTAAVVPEV